MSDHEAVSWPEVEAVASRIFDAPPQERATLLNELCGDRRALREQVETLLEADATCGDFLDTPALQGLVGVADVSRPADLRQASMPSVPGYRLVREIGQGGMGVVFAAEPVGESAVDRVAVKILRHDDEDGSLTRRFAQERDILDRLTHQHVANLLDAGTTDAGRPFVVMEYVAGQPITDYCDERRLSVTERLRLFRDVCRAVGYAHRSGIVHRDLKPSNVMVSSDATVKLLDFGIAKWIVDDSRRTDDRAPDTQTGQRVMTPRYAAPEQIRGQVVRTQTDVFALGLILYELLAGRHPFATNAWSIGETERAILDGRFTPASHAVTEVLDISSPSGTRERVHPDVVSGNRSADPEELRRRLRGDLDEILRCALNPDPDGRYANADLLGGDIDLHLRGRPVHVRRPSLWRRVAARFTRRRHPPAVPAESEREAARQARRADALLRFQVSMFELAAPSIAGRPDVTARQMLEWASGHVDDVLADEADARVDVLTTLGRIHQDIGEHEAAIEVLERSLAERRRVYGEEDFRLIDTLRWLGTAYESLGRPRDAIDTLTRAVTISRNVYGGEHLDTATRLNDLAIVKSRAGDVTEAKRLYQESLEIKRRQLADDDPSVMATINNQSVLLMRTGHSKQAEHLLWQVLAARRRRLGPENVYTVNTLHNIMVTRRRRGDQRGAEPLAREVVDIRTRVLGREHPDTTNSTFNLASILRDLGRLDEAERLFRDVRRGYDTHRRSDQPEALGAELGEAMVAHLRGRTDEAERVARDVCGRMAAAVGDDHATTGNVRLDHARLLVHASRFEEASEIARDVWAQRCRQNGDDSPVAAEALAVAGQALAGLGATEDARAALERALAVLEREWEPDHVEVSRSRTAVTKL